MTQASLQQALSIAAKLQRAGRFADAESIYRQILSHQPDHPEILHRLGVIVGQAGRYEEAVELIRRALAVAPANHALHFHLASFLQSQGQIDDAIASYQRAMELKPDFLECQNDLGTAWEAKGLLDKAIVCYEKALTLNPNFAAAHSNLGMALRASGHADQAIAHHQRAVAIDPTFPAAHYNLANAWKEIGKFDSAIDCYHRTIALRPAFSPAYSNLANTFKDCGRLNAAIACNQRALALRPDFVAAHDNLLMTLHYHPACTAQALLEECQRWNTAHALPLKSFILPHQNDRDPQRRLRIGYVSADFCDHVCAQFLLPLFRQHDRQQVEVYAYAQVRHPDPMTWQIQEHVDHWRSTVALNDAQVAGLVRNDQIDILVDLKLHTDNNRLLIFAHKPAPVQVTWLGYPGTTGLDTIDYRLTDPWLDPPDADTTCYSEKSIRLPDTFWCCDRPDSEPEVNDLPCLQNAFITFGCLNNFCKVTDDVISLWAKVLAAVPGSHLVLLTPQGSSRHRVLDLFKKDSIAPERIEFVAKQPHSAYLRTYHRIDIALDTFPYNGHTTSLDSYWMGVPVITLVGKTVVGRAGLGQLTNLGLTDLIAHTPEQFVRIVTDLATDRPRLTELRATLRQSMKDSPLMNTGRFARNIEAVYRTIWRNWCQS